MTSPTDRAAFEAAMAAEGYELNPKLHIDGTYKASYYASGWEMWQAATAAERERAAKVCRDRANDERNLGREVLSVIDAARSAAQKTAGV